MGGRSFDVILCGGLLMYRSIDYLVDLLPIGKGGSTTSSLPRSCGSRTAMRRETTSWTLDPFELFDDFVNDIVTMTLCKTITEPRDFKRETAQSSVLFEHMGMQCISMGTT